MTSIGPQLPAHFLKQQHPSEDEVDGSDDEAGPKSETIPSVTVDPQIQAHSAESIITSSIAEDDDDEDDYGPALPPDLLVKRPGASSNAAKAGPSTRSPSPPVPSRRILGPSLPGHNRQSYSDDEDSDDDGYGPMPLPAGAQNTDGVSEGVREFLEKEERRRKEVEEAAKPKKPKRDEWMLVPPSSSDLLGHLSDPTKLKARQFSRGGGTTSRYAPNNLWTETPAERQQRIADEVAGKKRRATNADDDASVNPEDDRRKRKRDSELRRVVDEHNKSSRGKTLLEMHDTDKGKEKKGKDDAEVPPGIWDHARDMSLGGRLMDEKQRSKLISDARSLGDRFGSGKGGGYL